MRACAAPLVCHAFTLVSEGFKLTHQADAEGRTLGCNRENAEHRPLHSAAIVTDLDAARKTYCTLRAHLALRGYSVFALSDETFIVSKWNLTKPLADLRALAVFARQIGCAA